eukprot:jgi/Botrbrau1/3585/Bobra.0078s0037.1
MYRHFCAAHLQRIVKCSSAVPSIKLPRITHSSSTSAGRVQPSRKSMGRRTGGVRGFSSKASASNGNHTSEDHPLQGYRSPPPEFLEIIDFPPEPSLSFSPDRTKVLQLYRPPPLPPITELARPELKLAGLRIDEEMNSRSRMSYYTGMALVDMTEDLVLPASASLETPITGYPEGFWINLVSWSRDSRHITFTVRSPGGPGDPPRHPLELWVA